MPYLRTLSSFRDGIRKLAIAGGNDAVKDILLLCDKLRDTDLVPLGVALDDQEGNTFQCKISASDLTHLSWRWKGSRKAGGSCAAIEGS